MQGLGGLACNHNLRLKAVPVKPCSLAVVESRSHPDAFEPNFSEDKPTPEALWSLYNFRTVPGDVGWTDAAAGSCFKEDAHFLSSVSFQQASCNFPS